MNGEPGIFDQVLKTLIGQPYLGVGPTISGVGQQLAGGGQGVLGGAGRLLMLLSSRSPTEAAAVLSRFQEMDQQRGAMLQDPALQKLTPEQFYQTTGYYPPTRLGVVSPIPGKTPSFTGNRAQLAQVINAPPPPPDVMMKYMKAENVVNRVLGETNEAIRAQILGNPGSAPESRALISAAMQHLKETIPNFDEKGYSVSYDFNEQGVAIPRIRERDQRLMTLEELQAFQAENPDKEFSILGIPSNIGPGGERLYQAQIGHRYTGGWAPMKARQQIESSALDRATRRAAIEVYGLDEYERMTADPEYQVQSTREQQEEFDRKREQYWAENMGVAFPGKTGAEKYDFNAYVSGLEKSYGRKVDPTRIPDLKRVFDSLGDPFSRPVVEEELKESGGKPPLEWFTGEQTGKGPEAPEGRPVTQRAVTKSQELASAIVTGDEKSIITVLRTVPRNDKNRRIVARLLEETRLGKDAITRIYDAWGVPLSDTEMIRPQLRQGE